MASASDALVPRKWETAYSSLTPAAAERERRWGRGPYIKLPGHARCGEARVCRCVRVRPGGAFFLSPCSVHSLAPRRQKAVLSAARANEGAAARCQTSLREKGGGGALRWAAALAAL